MNQLLKAKEKIMKENFDKKIWQQMLDIARVVIPCGGCLDDDWPDYRDRLSEAIYEKFSYIVDLDNCDQISDELMAEI